MTISENPKGYGIADGSYKAAGELAGLTKLVDDFYRLMDQLPEANHIRQMHHKDLTQARKKLTYFLSGWLGGPKLFKEHFGGIDIPSFHKVFAIGSTEKHAWLLCMERAVALQPYDDDFKTYLLAQLKIPAERIQTVSEHYHADKK